MLQTSGIESTYNSRTIMWPYNCCLFLWLTHMREDKKNIKTSIAGLSLLLLITVGCSESREDKYVRLRAELGASKDPIYAIKSDSRGPAQSPSPMRGQNPQRTGQAPDATPSTATPTKDSQSEVSAVDS
jgi:hypothetical protein